MHWDFIFTTVKVLNFDETNLSDINIEKYVNKYQLKLGELYKNRYIKMDGTCEELNCEILETVISEIPEWYGIKAIKLYF